MSLSLAPPQQAHQHNHKGCCGPAPKTEPKTGHAEAKQASPTSKPASHPSVILSSAKPAASKAEGPAQTTPAKANPGASSPAPVQGHAAKAALMHICSGSCSHGPKAEPKQTHAEAKQATPSPARPVNAAITNMIAQVQSSPKGHDAKAALAHICGGSCNHGPKQTSSPPTALSAVNSAKSRFALSPSPLPAQSQTAKASPSSQRAAPTNSQPQTVAANKGVPQPQPSSSQPLARQAQPVSFAQQPAQVAQAKGPASQAAASTTLQVQAAAQPKGLAQAGSTGSQTPASSTRAAPASQPISQVAQAKTVNTPITMTASKAAPTTQAAMPSTTQVQAAAPSKGLAQAVPSTQVMSSTPQVQAAAQPKGSPNGGLSSTPPATTRAQATATPQQPGQPTQASQVKGMTTPTMTPSAKVAAMTQGAIPVNTPAQAAAASKGPAQLQAQPQVQSQAQARPANGVQAAPMPQTQIQQRLAHINSEILVIGQLLIGQGIQAYSQALNHMIISRSLANNVFAALFAGSLVTKQKKEDLVRSLKQLLKKKKKLLEQAANGEVTEDPLANESFLLEWFTENKAYL